MRLHHPGGMPLRQALAWGVLWAVIVSAAEGAVVQAAVVQGWRQGLVFWLLVWNVPAWALVGCAQLLLAQRAQARGSRWPVAAGWLLLSLTWATVQPALAGVANDWLSAGAHGGWWSLDLILYNLWINLFYGGLLVGVQGLVLRAERARSLLHDAAMARSRTEAQRGEAELDALQQHIDPALLLGVMDEVQDAYRHTPDRADDLLARLVEFLRCAMPGLKDRASTLAIEMSLARAYARLQSARQPGGPRWTVTMPAALPALPFPGQWIVPMMSLAAHGSTPSLVLELEGDRVCMTVRGLAAALPPAVLEHAQMRLRSQAGIRCAFHIGTAQEMVLMLWPTSAPAPHHTEGVPHGSIEARA